jgi:hypothetical protein
MEWEIVDFRTNMLSGKKGRVEGQRGLARAARRAAIVARALLGVAPSMTSTSGDTLDERALLLAHVLATGEPAPGSLGRNARLGVVICR